MYFLLGLCEGRPVTLPARRPFRSDFQIKEIISQRSEHSQRQSETTFLVKNEEENLDSDGCAASGKEALFFWIVPTPGFG
ncbi:unnamed protein product [Caenorhabditis auriculariae]|uniref:Uncharacterized protein n=1 Tax=Caenorhabditis auriculariae TaxID=2777116 RepID=A0A8S1GN16_9PELO|nr:unnamed protein product [Caenorhabditis auriculariae]